MFGFRKKKKCGFTHQPCLKDKCMFWDKIEGVNPNTGEAVNMTGCTVSMSHLFVLDGAKMTNRVAQEVSSMRAENIQNTRNLAAVVASALGAGTQLEPSNTLRLANEDQDATGSNDGS